MVSPRFASIPVELLDRYARAEGLLVFVAILARQAWRWRNGLPQPVRPVSRLEHVTAVAAHVVLLILTVVLPLLHAAAALKHHLIDKDATLKRMLGRPPEST